MADKRMPLPNDVPDFVREVEEAMAKGETLAPQAEVTIKFGKGLVGEPFISKSSKELVQISIPNCDEADKRPWETFVVPANMVHENKFGKGMWMKLPENGTAWLSRPVRTGMDEAGKPTWGHETREVSNTELKSLLEAYKEKSRGSVLSDLSDKRAESAAAPKPAKRHEAAR